MRLVRPSFEIIEQGPGLEGIYKQIELAGRTCYKSEDKITEDSAKKFVDMLIARGHTAMLEHGTVYLRVDDEYDWYDLKKYVNYPWVKYKVFYSGYTDDIDCVYITSNYRWIIENNLEDYLEYLCEPTEYHEKRVSVKFVTSIGIGRELLRHRVFSFANESTRYCNYSKDSLGNGITFIIPNWWEKYKRATLDSDGHREDKTSDMCVTEEIQDTLKDTENQYLAMIIGGAKPEEAREVLPLCTKSELVMTGFISDWQKVFAQRVDSITGKPHPDMKALIEPVKEEFITRQWLRK